MMDLLDAADRRELVLHLRFFRKPVCLTSLVEPVKVSVCREL
jgi:hypothetical protein